MKIAVTGANGFIGAALCQALRQQGHEVLGWVRKPSSSKERAFSLPEVDPGLFSEHWDCLIHAAYVTRFQNPQLTQQVNLEGSLRLFALAEAKGIPMVFISSLSAHAEAVSIYGSSKYQLEQTLDLQKHVVVKPGLVLGPGGVFLRMMKLLQKCRVAPVFWGGNQILYTVHVHDLIDALCKIVQDGLRGRFHVMETNPNSMREFYQQLMMALGLTPRLLPCPGDLCLWGARLFERLGMVLPISSENLLGLQKTQYFQSDCQVLGIQPLAMAESLRQVIQEMGEG